MSLTITDAERLTYKDGFMARVEDRPQALWNLFPMEPVEGLMQRVDFVGPIEGVQTANSRFTPIQGVDPTHTNRWIATVPNEQAVFVDKKDIKRVVSDPRSAYMDRITGAFMRKREDVIIAAMDATVTTGETGTTTQAFDTTNQQIAAGGTNLTIDKLLDALYILESRAYASVENGDVLYFVYSPKQKQSLLKISEVVNSDYSAHKALMDGRVASFMGFTFMMSNRLIAGDGLGVGVSTSRECYAFTADALIRGEGINRIISVDERRDLTKWPWQLYAMEDIGALRLHEEKVVKVICDETA